MQLDRTLSDLFEFVDDEVGLEHTLIVLSADHGMAEMPEYATGLGHAAGRLYSDEVLAIARQVSADRFGSDQLVKDFFRPYLYLDHTAISERNLQASEVAAVLARELEQVPGIGGAVTRAEARAGATSRGGTAAAINANFHPARAGDIYIFQAPYWFLFDRGAIAVMHGSPWSYDQHVPLIFAGPGIEPRVISRRVNIVDVAPTLSSLLSILPPAGAQGRVLEEVLAR